MKKKIRKECYRRVRGALQSELNAKNKLETINTLAIPVVTHSFIVVNLNLEEINRIDRKMQKLTNLNRVYHPKADMSRIYIPRKEGGRGTTNLKMAYKATTIGLNSYLQSSGDRIWNAVLQHSIKEKEEET